MVCPSRTAESETMPSMVVVRKEVLLFVLPCFATKLASCVCVSCLDGLS